MGSLTLQAGGLYLLIGTIANAGEGTETYVYGGVTVTYTVNEDGDRAVVAIT